MIAVLQEAVVLNFEATSPDYRPELDLGLWTCIIILLVNNWPYVAIAIILSVLGTKVTLFFYAKKRKAVSCYNSFMEDLYIKQLSIDQY